MVVWEQPIYGFFYGSLGTTLSEDSRDEFMINFNKNSIYILPIIEVASHA